MKIKIGGKLIGAGNPCFIIAEAGVNHNGKLSLAKKLIDKAKEAGVDAVKFQTFKAENIVTKEAKQAKYQTKNIGKKESQFAMLKRLELSYADFRNLKKYCARKKIIFLSTPHSSKEDVDIVAELCPVIKIASGDLTNLPFLKYIAKKDLPIILSTGMANLREVKEAVKTILSINKKIILLHCTTNYPTPVNEVNLRAMFTMGEEFNLPVGYSDHTQGMEVSLAAAAMGACVIEKHFTLNKKLPGPDHKASLGPEELKAMVRGIRNIQAALGDGTKKPTPSEMETAKVARKSIVAAKNIKKGTEIREDMLAIKRPGTGIAPKYFSKILGKKAKKDIKKDSLINWEQLL
ncbi:MAG: N-acetylneuraminate synthase [Candidatus Nealsonbacteria bacterium RIFCSPLOWO2_01_FULL_41_9]|uniref:N-acetylneuraminate synthase n=1 Tax=Candidatus Nealsonbacteria bacterium RIFCSPLOWO2_01_FULL_41_9 TaxID=1801671 RepID=A0A1G2ECC3_9BACT|nr:MAG: N-acetylneuraminate synthase [Candidatus Nealsonbacteria bacterium RIFCSPLOWO2_01_FULL_41_9]